jgi:hypothetical protein
MFIAGCAFHLGAPEERDMSPETNMSLLRSEHRGQPGLSIAMCLLRSTDK